MKRILSLFFAILPLLLFSQNVITDPSGGNIISFYSKDTIHSIKPQIIEINGDVVYVSDDEPTPEPENNDTTDCDYMVSFDGTNDVTYSNSLNPHTYKAAVKVRIKSFTETNTYSALWGGNSSGQWLALDASNNIAFRVVSTFHNFVSNSTIKGNSHWWDIWFVSDSLSARVEVHDSAGTMISGNTLMLTTYLGIKSVGGGYSNNNFNADVIVDQFEVYDLSGMTGSIAGGEITVTAIKATNPIHRNNFSEGIGSIIHPNDFGTIEGTINEVKVETWLVTRCP